MVFYRLLYSVSSDDLLREYYYEIMSSILEYDRSHDSSLKETLFRYVLHNGSLQAVVNEMICMPAGIP